MEIRLSKGFFLGSFIGAGVINLLLTALIVMAGGDEIIFLFVGLSLIPTIYVTIVGCIMWYRAWSSIQDEYVRTTPGKAVGFMFIPVYNIYWIFQVIAGFAKDYNAYVDRNNLNTNKLSEALFTTAPIMILISAILNRIPAIGAVYSIAMLIVMVILVNSLIDGVNSLAAAGVRPAGAGTPRTQNSFNPEADSSNNMIGIIAVALSGYAIFQGLISAIVFSTGLYGSWFGRGLMGLFPLLYWGFVVYLGSLCRNKVLKIIAMCLPIIPVIMYIWQIFKYRF